MAGTRKSTVQQVTVHLTSEEVEFLKTQAGIDGVSFNDVLRRSIILELPRQRELETGQAGRG